MPAQKNESRTRMHLNGVNSQHDKETGLRNSRDPYALVNWRPPSLTSSKVFRGETAGSLQPGQTRPQPPRRAHVSGSTFALRLGAGSGDSGLSAGFRGKAARGAHPRAQARGPAAPPRRVPAVRAPGGPLRGRGLGTRSRPGEE